MLADPKWDQLPRFKSWLENQPGDGEYAYCNSMNCAVAQFLTSEHRFTTDWLSNYDNTGINELARGDLDQDHDAWNFGDLLERTDAKIKELA